MAIQGPQLGYELSELMQDFSRELGSLSRKDHTLQLRLVAGLVAYVSMLQHGSVKVQLRDGKGHLGPQRLTKLMEKFMHHLGCSKNHTKPM